MTTRSMRVTAAAMRLAQGIRPMRLMRVIGLVLLAAALSGGQGAATTWRLASAQVVTSTVDPPMLKLIAGGPIAFQVLPADATGAPVGPDRVVARLYGIAPGDLASSSASGDLAPFVLTVTAEASANGTDTDTLVTIATGAIGSASDRRLVLRAGMKANEIEAAIVPVQ